MLDWLDSSEAGEDQLTASALSPRRDDDDLDDNDDEDDGFDDEDLDEDDEFDDEDEDDFDDGRRPRR